MKTRTTKKILILTLLLSTMLLVACGGGSSSGGAAVAQNNSLAIAKTLDSNADEDASGTVSLNDTLTYSVVTL